MVSLVGNYRCLWIDLTRQSPPQANPEKRESLRTASDYQGQWKGDILTATIRHGCRVFCFLAEGIDPSTSLSCNKVSITRSWEDEYCWQLLLLGRYPSQRPGAGRRGCSLLLLAPTRSRVSMMLSREDERKWIVAQLPQTLAVVKKI